MLSEKSLAKMAGVDSRLSAVIGADAVKAAARQLGFVVEWGGDWKTLKDGPHFQLANTTRSKT